jgi:hypothetical protein
LGAGFVASELENTLGLPATVGELGGSALEPGKSLPWRLVQLTKDFKRWGFHVLK